MNKDERAQFHVLMGELVALMNASEQTMNEDEIRQTEEFTALYNFSVECFSRASGMSPVSERVALNILNQLLLLIIG